VHVLRAKIENLYGMAGILRETHVLELKKGSSVLDALEQIPGIDVEAPNIPIDEYML